VNLADLETLLAVARERSFSRAAERLRRTQPAVSLAIRRLEAACGERLLERSQPPRLTPAGEAVARRAERMLWHRGRISQELAELRGLQRGLVTIGANESTALWLLSVVEAFHARHSGRGAGRGSGPGGGRLRSGRARIGRRDCVP
jgi:DNA-binding transcriptional LysR family regulator